MPALRRSHELTGNFQVGPLAFNNAKLIIDSKDGVTMNRGNMSFDPVAIANDLQASFGCDFKGGVAGCRIAGFQVLSASASVVGGQPKMNVTLDLLGLGSVAFEMTSGSPLQFSAQVSVGQALGGFNAGNGKLTIQGDSVTIETSQVIDELERVLDRGAERARDEAPTRASCASHAHGGRRRERADGACPRSERSDLVTASPARWRCGGG